MLAYSTVQALLVVWLCIGAALLALAVLSYGVERYVERRIRKRKEAWYRKHGPGGWDEGR